MSKILFIQGIHNFSLREQFVKDVSHATGMEVVYFPSSYSIFDTQAQKELIGKINEHIATRHDSYIILAHSFGGILAYSLEDETYKRVEKIITFASPHQVPFSWFKKRCSELGYRHRAEVACHDSCGFYFDTTVPFFFTRYKNGRRHKNFLGSHTWVKDRKTFFKNLVSGNF